MQHTLNIFFIFIVFQILGDAPLPSISGPVQNEEQQCILLVRTMSILLPFLFISVLKSGPFVEHLESTCNFHDTEVDGKLYYLFQNV